METKRAHGRQPRREHYTLLAHWTELALAQMPYFSPILLNLRAVDSPGLGTFAVDDAMRLYIDFDAVAERGHQWCAESLLHECGHVWNQHRDRAEKMAIPTDARSRRDWNIATDMAINSTLVQAGCTTLADMLPDLIGEPRHLSAEHYYATITDARNRHGQHHCPDCASATGPDGRATTPHRGHDNEPGMPGSRCRTCGGTIPTGCGSGSGGLTMPTELGSDDLGGFAAPAHQSDIDTSISMTAEAIIKHGTGNVPGGLTIQAESVIAPPKVPWYQTLSARVRRAAGVQTGRRRTTYQQRDRHRLNIRLGTSGPKVIYPGTITPRLCILVVRDTSASVTPHQLGQFNTEVVAVSRSMGVRNLYVMDVDALVHEVVPFTSPAQLMTATGGGDTDMRVAIEAATEMRHRPDIVIILTDGMTPWPDDPPPFPVIVCLPPRSRDHKAVDIPDWATTVIMD